MRGFKHASEAIKAVSAEATCMRKNTIFLGCSR